MIRHVTTATGSTRTGSCIQRVLYFVALWLFRGFFFLILMHFDWSLGHSFILLCGTFVPDVGLRQKILKRVKRLESTYMCYIAFRGGKSVLRKEYRI